MKTKLIFLFSIFLLAGLLTACGTPALARSAGDLSAQTDQPPMRTMNVTGTGKVYLTPDIVYINVGVHTEGPNAAEAVAQNNSQAAKLKSSLIASGVAEKDIQTTNFSIYPQQKFDDKGQPTGEITYMVDNTVAITVRDTSKVGDVLDAAVKAGANNIFGIQFDVEDKSEAMSQAREAAVKNAETVANELATAAGVTLGPIQTISSYGGAPVPIYEGKGGGMAAASNVPVSPGQMVLTVDVSMVYEIR